MRQRALGAASTFEPQAGVGGAGAVDNRLGALGHLRRDRGRFRANVETRLGDDIGVTIGFGNIFADLGVAEPEEELTKAQLASHIRGAIKRRKLTQAQAADLIGVDQPKVSALINGRLSGFSSDRLLRCLTALGQDVDIVVKAAPGSRAHGRLRVIEKAD